MTAPAVIRRDSRPYSLNDQRRDRQRAAFDHARIVAAPLFEHWQTARQEWRTLAADPACDPFALAAAGHDCVTAEDAYHRTLRAAQLAYLDDPDAAAASLIAPQP